MNRGKRRIWLEGNELLQNGIKHGDRYSIISGHNWLSICINSDGRRKVAGAPGRPIIDMTGATVTEAFSDDVEYFEILSTPGNTGIVLKGIKS
jgi:hypothetical protein